jgi:hypothetical protein
MPIKATGKITLESLPKGLTEQIIKGMFPLEVVVWRDHWFESTGTDPESAESILPMIHITAGFVWKETPDMLSMAMTGQTDKQVGENLHIMPDCILARGVIPIRVKKKKKNADAGSDLRTIRSLPED